ncbi:hypothetical protein PENNAL_c0107G07007 [Penicillium nalgiovense]|uniref:Uncharacterized protein n=1 Tax=Penicillium nalgiovense TaxID=60175 RepID=A0A1V6X829_PENNA|nr:hypothetical protein PENNAL_c0107G07007 [Penicillium nalgiovense]
MRAKSFEVGDAGFASPSKEHCHAANLRELFSKALIGLWISWWSHGVSSIDAIFSPPGGTHYDHISQENHENVLIQVKRLLSNPVGILKHTHSSMDVDLQLYQPSFNSLQSSVMRMLDSYSVSINWGGAYTNLDKRNSLPYIDTSVDSHQMIYARRMDNITSLNQIINACNSMILWKKMIVLRDRNVFTGLIRNPIMAHASCVRVPAQS